MLRKYGFFYTREDGRDGNDTFNFISIKYNSDLVSAGSRITENPKNEKCGVVVM